MSNTGSQKTSALAIGIGILVGECVFGVNGPFLFNRIGMNVPESVATGVLVGATIGFGVAGAALRSSRRLLVNSLHLPGDVSHERQESPIADDLLRHGTRFGPEPVGVQKRGKDQLNLLLKGHGDHQWLDS